MKNSPILSKITFENESYIPAGTIKLNRSAFVIALRDNVIYGIDFTNSPELANIGFSKATLAENIFINDFLVQRLQEKANNGEIEIRNLDKVCNEINEYINIGDEEYNKPLDKENKTELLYGIKELAGLEESIILERKDVLLENFANRMNGNKYFYNASLNDVQNQEIVEDVEPQDSIKAEQLMEPTSYEDIIAPSIEEMEKALSSVYNSEEVLQPSDNNLSNEEPIIEFITENNVQDQQIYGMQSQNVATPNVETISYEDFMVPVEEKKEDFTLVNNEQVPYEIPAQNISLPNVETISFDDFAVPETNVQDFQIIENNEPMNMQPSQEIVQESRIPEYDEAKVTAVLEEKSKSPETFDVDAFIDAYSEHFTQRHINLLLNNFQLSEEKQTQLKDRKEIIKSVDSLAGLEIRNLEEAASQEQAKENTKGKRKKLTLLGDKNNAKKAAFVDTLLLSFTVGTICGVYLMYFVLTIMS